MPDPGSPFAWRTFELALRPWLGLALHDIHIDVPGPEPGPEQGRPVLLVANHTSWYDGFLLREIQRRHWPGAVLRTIMLSRELRGRPPLRMIGGTGFDPDRPQTLRAVVRELAAVAQRRPTVVSFFPQGTIRPSWVDPPGFREGTRLVQRALAPLTVRSTGLHLEMGNRTRPTAFVSAGPARAVRDADEALDAAELESTVGRELDRIHHHLEEHGEKAGAEWPPARRQ